MNEAQQKWLEARVEELLGQEVDEALAAAPAPPADADLLTRAAKNRHGATCKAIEAIKAEGAWDDQARALQTAILAAIIELSTQGAIEMLGGNPYGLPIPELARRAAALEVAASEGMSGAELLPLLIEALFGRGVRRHSEAC